MKNIQIVQDIQDCICYGKTVLKCQNNIVMLGGGGDENQSYEYELIVKDDGKIKIAKNKITVIYDCKDNTKLNNIFYRSISGNLENYIEKISIDNKHFEFDNSWYGDVMFDTVGEHTINYYIKSDIDINDNIDLIKTVHLWEGLGYNTNCKTLIVGKEYRIIPDFSHNKFVNIKLLADSCDIISFYGCDCLETIEYNKITNISSGCFKNCVMLKSLPNITPNDIVPPSSLFEDCWSANNVYKFPNYIGVNDSTFKNCKNIESIILHDGITIISKSAFDGCKKLTITIPASVNKIDVDAFKDVKKVYMKNPNYESMSGYPWGATDIEYLPD